MRLIEARRVKPKVLPIPPLAVNAFLEVGMDMKQRNKAVVKSFRWEFINQIIVILLGLLAPRFIIASYGSEVNGLSSTINQVMRILLMLQAGASTAAIFSLYKPVADNDFEKIGEQVAAIHDFFKKTAILFSAILVAAAVVFTWYMQKQSTLVPFAILSAFLLLGLRNAMDLLFTSRYRAIFGAYQQKHIISIAMLLEQGFYYAMIFVTIALRLHFLFMYVWFVIGCVIKVLYLQILYQKRFGATIPKKSKTKAIIPGRKYAFANEVAHSVMASSATILVSILYGFGIASVFAIYNLVIYALSVFSSSIYNSFSPSFGNLVAGGDHKRINQVHRLFTYLLYAVCTVLFMTTMYTILPFVRVYTKGIADVQYINSTLSVLIVVNAMVSIYRVPLNVAVATLGRFKETWLQPVITMVIALAVSCGLGLLGYEYVLIGPILFYAVNYFYQYTKLRKIEPALALTGMHKNALISMAGILIVYLLTLVMPSGAKSITKLLVTMGMTFIGSCVYVLLMLVLWQRDMLPEIKNYLSAWLFKPKKGSAE
ncbi:MAG: hypothetical protein IH607_01680 [Firmicutes bacterium]|nr:hypothetical protein [Bacillota bacterium]